MIRTLLLVLVLCPHAVAETVRVDDADGLQSAIAKAKPGETITMAEGQWQDIEIVFVGAGTKNAPITLCAERPGKTILSGTSTLRIGGEYLVVSGLRFVNPDPSVSDLIDFRKDSKQLSSHCRMTQCSVTVDDSKPNSSTSRWVGVYGHSNRVDHCRFAGKNGKGATFVVWLGGDNRGEHQIDHNDFGRRQRLGKNGGETIRIGDSKTSMIEAKCLVEKNRFEQCNGENECISNKSGGNVYRSNHFIEVSGTLTLRHGNGCLVEGNVFLGNGAPGTGGIRIIGEDHVVRGNYLERLTGDDGRSAISMMMGIPNSPLNRYSQVKRARVEGNTIVECKWPVLIGLKDDKNASLEPIDSDFVSNVVVSTKRPMIEGRSSLAGIRWKQNHFFGPTLYVNGSASSGDVSLTDHPPEVVRPKAMLRSEIGPSWFASE